MGKLIYSMMVSLDGFVETPDREIDWVIVDEEVHRFANAEMRECGASLYGRRLYELMAAFWPTADADPDAQEVIAEFSRLWKDKPKVVYSTTLESVGWNGRLAREVVPEEVAALKRQYGDLEVGGPALASTFIELGLVDEYGLYVNPIVLGSGTPFFPASIDRRSLRLVETREFGSGVVFLRYRVADAQ